MSSKLKINNLKKEGRRVFNKSFVKCIAVCFIVTILIGGTTTSIIKKEVKNYDYSEYFNQLDIKSNSDIVIDFIKGVKEESNVKIDKYLEGANAGVLANIANNISKSDSFLFGTLNAINQMIFKDKIGAGIVILIGTMITFIYYFFVGNVIKVGQCRFFLENRRYGETKIRRILFPYRLKKEWNVAKIMFVREVYTFFWSFTIVFGFVKRYEYFFIPYILAENPDISLKDAFRISKEMARGYKWKLFVMELSFILYYVVGIMSFNLFNLFYTNPFKECVFAELYMNMREDYIDCKKVNNELLCDDYLDVKFSNNSYPIDKYFLPTLRTKVEISDVNIKYSFIDIIMLFFAYSFIGYAWEVLLHLFSDGTFVNRGTLYGPYLPIYGFGGVLSLLLLKRYSKNIGLTFILSMFLCGIIEYFTSLYLDVLYNMKWWDYSGYLFNINGRICLEGLLVFGFGCTVGIYILSPLLKRLFNHIKYKYRVIISSILVVVIMIDLGFSIFKPNQGKGISSPNDSEEQVYIE
ncbi:MAG: DUF975 family protein [Bacilli bacterium]